MSQVTIESSDLVFSCGADYSNLAPYLTAKVHNGLTIVSCKLDPNGEPVKKEVSNIRGQVFNKQGLLIAGFAHAPRCVGKYIRDVMHDENGNEHSLDGATFWPLREGFLLRVAKIEGKIIYSTNRSLTPEKSFYGDPSKRFLDLFFNGLKKSREEFESELFSDPRPYSAYAYFFVVNSQYVRNASRDPDHGTLYIGSYLQHGEGASHPELRVSIDSELIDTIDRASDHYTYEPLSFEEASLRLLRGESDFISEWTEEPILAKLKNGTTLRIFPEGYVKRLRIVGNSLNRNKRLCELMVLSYANQYKRNEMYQAHFDDFLRLQRPDGWNGHVRRTDLFAETEAYLPPSLHEELFQGDNHHQVARFYHLAMLYAFSLPLCHQLEVMRSATEMITKRENVINALTTNYNKVLDLQVKSYTNAKGEVLDDKNDVEVLKVIQRIVRESLKFGGSCKIIQDKITNFVLWENQGLYTLLFRFDVARLL
jgi:hypothetical protein